MDWKDIIERAVWTGVEAPAVVAVIDFVDTQSAIPDRALLYAAGLGFAAAAIKSIAKDRLEALKARYARRHAA